MSKPLVFISHITEERELAIFVKKLIESSFSGRLQVALPTIEYSISAGRKWPESIPESLKKCSLEIVLCSPQSIKRSVINFEAGAGCIRGIPVIPLCHSGLEPSRLPMPLNLLEAEKVSNLKLLLKVLAKAIGEEPPRIDCEEFISKVKDFEIKNIFWDECDRAFSRINAFDSQIINDLKLGKKIVIDLKECDISCFETFMPLLRQNKILDLRRNGNTKITIKGVFFTCEINILEKFDEFIKFDDLKY